MLFNPSKDFRVCSVHFIDTEPTELNPHPTENLGYDAKRKISTLNLTCSKCCRSTSISISSIDDSATDALTTNNNFLVAAGSVLNGIDDNREKEGDESQDDMLIHELQEKSPTCPKRKKKKTPLN